METDFGSDKIITDIGYIKLIKSSKGYNWEIKMYDTKNETDFKRLLEKINELNLRMVTLFNDKHEK